MALARGTSPFIDRRRALRAPLHGTAVLHGDRAAVNGNLEDISLTGARLHVRDLLGRTDALEIELHLTRTIRIVVTAEAVRTERRDDGPRLAVRFLELSADHEDAIEDAIERALASARLRPVLVVDGIEDRRLDLVDALRARNMTPLTPTTPLEVVDLLATPEHHVPVAAIGARFADIHGREMAAMIAETFPWVRIMVIGNDAGEMATDIAAAWDDLDYSSVEPTSTPSAQ